MVQRLKRVDTLPPVRERLGGGLRVKLLARVYRDGMPEFDENGQKIEHVSPRQVIINASTHTFLGQIERNNRGNVMPDNDNFHTFSRAVSVRHLRFDVAMSETTVFLKDLNSERGTWVSTCEPRGADNLDDHAPQYEVLKKGVTYEVPTGSLIRIGDNYQSEGFICQPPEWLLQVEPDDQGYDAMLREAADRAPPPPPR